MENLNIEKIKITGCLCVECRWEGKVTETNTETYYDQFKGIDSSFPICPKCGGIIKIIHTLPTIKRIK